MFIGGEKQINKKEVISAQKGLKFALEKIYDFIVEKRKWVLVIIAAIMLSVLVKTAVNYFTIQSKDSGFSAIEVKIKTDALEIMEDYLKRKEDLLVEKQQRVYRDLFR